TGLERRRLRRTPSFESNPPSARKCARLALALSNGPVRRRAGGACEADATCRIRQMQDVMILAAFLGPTRREETGSVGARRQPLIGRVNRESGMNHISDTATYAPYAIHGLMNAATMPMP